MDPLKFLLFLKFISTLTTIQSTQLKIRDHVQVIMDFYSFYQSTSLTILHFTNLEQVPPTDVIFNIVRILSKEKMMTSIITFEQLTPLNYYNKLRDLKQSAKPLNVIFITSKNSALKMKNVTKNFPLHESINLIFFIKIDEDPLTDLCTFPVGNPFGLRFDTLLYVKCYDDNHIREWYLQYSNQTFLYDWATWDFKLGLNVRAKESVHTKRGLDGRVLRIATVKNSYFIEWKNGHLTGFFGDLLCELQEAMNFTVKLIANTDTYGRWDEISQTWTGALGLAVRGEVDLVVSDFSFSKFRMCCVDFTVPLLSVKNCLYIKRSFNELEVSWYGHFRPFSYNSWVTLILLLLIAPTLLTFMEKQVKKCLVKSKFISNNFLDIWALFCQQSVTDNPSISSLRVAYNAISISAFIIVSVYSASLTSSLALPTINLPFKTIEEFVEDGTYKLAVVKDSSKYDIFRYSNDSTFIGMTKLFLKKNMLPISLQDGLNMACKEKIAFYDRETAIDARTVTVNCQLDQIQAGQIDTVAMLMRKNSPYKFMINQYLQKMESNGVLQRLRLKYFSRNFSEHIFWTKSTNYKKVEFRQIVLLLAIVGSGIILGTIALLAEKLISTYKHTSRIETIKSNVDLKIEVKKSAQYHDQDELILNFLNVNYNHRVVQTPIRKLINSDK